MKGHEIFISAKTRTPRIMMVFLQNKMLKLDSVIFDLIEKYNGTIFYGDDKIFPTQIQRCVISLNNEVVIYNLRIQFYNEKDYINFKMRVKNVRKI